MPRRWAQDATMRRPIVHMPCGECGLQLSYVRGDTEPLLKHMSVAHPRKQVLDFGSSEVDDDPRVIEVLSLEDCSACDHIKQRLLSQLGRHEDVVEQDGGSYHVQVGSSSETDGVKINHRVYNNEGPKHSRTRFTRTMKNDDEFYESEKTRAVSMPGKPLSSRTMPMALKHLKQVGNDVASHKEAKRTMVFHPAGKLYSNLRKFTCPKCNCEWPPVLSAIREGEATKSDSINECLLTTCWPLMLLPVFYVNPTMTFHVRCAKCDFYLGKLDRNGSVVTEVVVLDDAASTTVFGDEGSETRSKSSWPTNGSRGSYRSRSVPRRVKDK